MEIERKLYEIITNSIKFQYKYIDYLHIMEDSSSQQIIQKSIVKDHI